MTEENEPLYYSEPVKKFESCGVLTLTASGKSFKLEIEDPSSIFTRTYYINRDSVIRVDKGHKKEATIFYLQAQDQ